MSERRYGIPRTNEGQPSPYSEGHAFGCQCLTCKAGPVGFLSAEIGRVPARLPDEGVFDQTSGRWLVRVGHMPRPGEYTFTMENGYTFGAKGKHIFANGSADLPFVDVRFPYTSRVDPTLTPEFERLQREWANMQAACGDLCDCIDCRQQPETD